MSAATAAVTTTAVLLAVLLLAAGLSTAHGSVVRHELRAGPYQAELFVEELLEHRDVATPFWNVTLAASGGPVAWDAPHMRVRSFDATGALVNETLRPLRTGDSGYWSANVIVGPVGRIELALPLPEAELVHTQDVCRLDPRTGDRICAGDEAGDRGLPGVGVAVALPLLAALARALEGTRRRAPGPTPPKVR